jgi:hypothetical protein
VKCAEHLIRPPAPFSPSDAEKELFGGHFPTVETVGYYRSPRPRLSIGANS